MKYPGLKLNVDNTQINSYIASEKGDIANHYTPLLNLDSETGRGNFTSSGLNFDALKPIQMDIVPEYDGSVNVIMNDDRHLPKLINSGFSVEENNTYKIPEHNGNAVTNVYDNTTLEGDTSLFKLYKSIPTLTFNGILDGGSFPCGSFVFYFRLADADGNVTNIIQESGVVQVHMGQVNSKHVRMGQENENSLKLISFTLTDLDKTFDYVKVLYEKTSGNGKDGAVVTSYYMVDRNYHIRNGKCDILITGAEGVISELTLQDIQTQYADIQTAKTLAIEQNTLFLGNVSAYEVQHKKLQQLVWRIIPKEITQSDLGHISSQYDFQNGYGYYDVKNVYNFTGYWADEIYKFGICFIYGNNHVSKVFPLQGIDFNKLGSADIDYVYRKNYTTDGSDKLNPEYWETDTEDHFFHKEFLTNSQGVIRFSKGSDIDTKASYNIKARGIQFTLSSDIIKELAKLNIVGLFFVRQKRVPTILGQGVVIGLTSKETGSLPVIQNSGSYCAKSFLDENRMLTQRGGDISNLSHVTTLALLLPDAELLTPIYNDILNSEEFCLERVGHFDKSVVNDDAGSFKNFSSGVGNAQLVKLTSVPLNSKILTNGTDYFSTLAGYPEEAWRVVDIKQVWDETPPQLLTKSTSLVRGQFGYYVGMSSNSFIYGDVVNIKLKKFLDESAYELAFMERFLDATPYFSISRRINLPTKGTAVKCYGGDCFMSVFTHKMCNNFADTELPTNTKIIDSKCWAKNFIVRTTAYCSITTHSNVSKSNDGFWLDNVSPSTKKGIPTYNHEIVEEATLDVAAYPTQVMDEGDLENEEIKDTTYSSIVQSYKDSAQTDATDSSYITYQEDVIIGQTVDSDEYKDDGYQKASWIKAFLAPGAFPLTTIILLAKAAKYRRDGISPLQAFGFLSKNQKEPVQTGVGVLDALIKVKYYKNHNFVTRGLTNINRSDVNAVSFGLWITFPICSSINLAFRDVDMSNSTEEAAHNHKRTFYPYEGQNAELHLLESQTVNGGAKKSISTNGILLYPSVPYIKQEFFNRIYWSRPNNTQSIINSYRLVYDRQFKEYNKEYGSITKIIPQKNTLLVVFQHGIGLLSIDTLPKTEAETSQYMAMRSVLSVVVPVSDMYGSMWQDSVITTPQHSIYGVDTVARKIWRFGLSFELLSEMKVEKFLNDFIDLSEFDFTEYLGHVNVKTHYNAFKYDVIFTFYKDKVASWQMTQELIDDIREYILQGRTEIEIGVNPGQSNLISNIQISDIENNQIYVTYQVSKNVEGAIIWDDRDETFTLRKGHAYSSTNNILDSSAKPLTWEKGTTWSLCYNEALSQFTTFYDWYPLLSENIDNIYFSFDKDAYEDTLNGSVSGIETINIESNDLLEVTTDDKSLIDRNFNGTVKVIENISDKDAIITVTNPKGIVCYYEWNDTDWDFKTIYGINKNKQIIAITSNIVLTPQQTIADLHTVDIDYLVKCGAINADKTEFINNTTIDQYYLKNSSTIPSMALWKHGLAGLFDNQGEIKPTNWYGKQHEFNFEFIAKGDDAGHKIFNNLYILSNKAEPSKFEYEVVGETYEWWDYKPIIEWINKQEIPAGAADTYWYDYIIGKTAEEILQVYLDFPDFYPEELYENAGAAVNNTRIITKLPYLKMKLTDKKGSPEVPIYDYDGISPKDNWDNLAEHPVNKYAFNCNEECLIKDTLLNELRVHSEQLGNNVKKYGRTRGNMQYKEDSWKVEIRPIKFTWYYKQDGELKTFTTETRHRDKYIKIKVRYSGEDLAIISAIYTLFNDSFA